MPYEFSSFTSKPFFLTNFIIKVIFITFSSLWASTHFAYKEIL